MSSPLAHRTPPLRSRSLSCKSRPTCTLSLAHVSACKPENLMQVDSTLQLGLFVAVPLPQVPVSLKKTKSKTKSSTTTIPNDINVIPFPTSAQTTPSTASAGSTTTSHTSNSFKQHQKKEDNSPVSLSASPPRKRARKGSLSTSPPSSSRPSIPSARMKALAQRRPPTPNPDSWFDSSKDVSVGDKSPVQPSSADHVQHPTADPNHQQTSQGEKGQDVEKHGHPELPPYSPSPPPYSPPVVASMPVSSPTPIPLHVPIPVVPPTPTTSSSSASVPETSTAPSQIPRPLPVSSPPPPQSSSSISPPPQRKSRISPSELRFFIFLYRSVVSGLEMRRQTRLNTQQVRRARDGSRREQHLDGVLVEVDDDEDVDVDILADYDTKVDRMDANEPTPSLNEALEAQDALLALRLRGFLKWNGVDEWMLKVNSSSPSPSPSSSPTSVNPFLEDDRMDVDVQQPPLPMLSSRHLITVLRMRGTCGAKQGGPTGLKFGRDQSKLRICAFKAEGDD